MGEQSRSSRVFRSSTAGFSRVRPRVPFFCTDEPSPDILKSSIILSREPSPSRGASVMRGLVLRGCVSAFWYLVALAWFLFVAVTVTLICFRGVKASGIGNAIQFNDIPLLRHFDKAYPD